MAAVMTQGQRRRAQDMLRSLVDGETALRGVQGVIERSKVAYTIADKDSVPALALELKAHLALLNKVLPDVKAVDITSDNPSDGLPTLLLDLLGHQPLNVPQALVDQANQNPRMPVTIQLDIDVTHHHHSVDDDSVIDVTPTGSIFD